MGMTIWRNERITAQHRHRLDVGLAEIARIHARGPGHRDGIGHGLTQERGWACCWSFGSSATSAATTICAVASTTVWQL
jgi:hypothetical protein